MAYLIHQNNRSDWLDQIIKLKPLNQSEKPNELLYGRAGYLYTLLFVKKTSPDTSKEKLDTLICEVYVYSFHSCLLPCSSEWEKSGSFPHSLMKIINFIALIFSWK